MEHFIQVSNENTHETGILKLSIEKNSKYWNICFYFMWIARAII